MNTKEVRDFRPKVNKCNKMLYTCEYCLSDWFEDDGICNDLINLTWPSGEPYVAYFCCKDHKDKYLVNPRMRSFKEFKLLKRSLKRDYSIVK